MRMHSAKSRASEDKSQSNPNKAVVTYSFRDLYSSKEKQSSQKIKDQLQWLESVVNGFEHYRFKQNQLFLTEEEECVQNIDKSKPKHLKNFQIIKISPKAQITPRNDLVRSKTINRIALKQLKTKKNNLQEATQNKRKGNTNSSSNLKQKSLSARKTFAQQQQQKALNKEKKQNKKIVSVKQGDDKFKNLENVNNEIQKKLGKSSPRDIHRKISFTRKAANIKAARKNLLQDSSVTGNLKNVGKIVRNKEIENATLPAKKCQKTIEQFLNIPQVVTEPMETQQQLEITINKNASKNQILKKQKQINFCKETDPRQILKRELEFKKYEYYIESNKKEDKRKQQRRLNSSVGERSKVHFQDTYSTSKLPNQSVSQQKARIKTQEETATFKFKTSDKKLCISQLCSQIDSTRGQYQQENGRIKIAISMQNSETPSEQNSMVLQKTSNMKTEEALENQQNDWNILQIFAKLDCRKKGVIDCKNCSIQSLSREIRYIMGPILEEILYRNATYTLGEFIEKADEILDKIKESALEKELTNFMEIKQYAPMTKRSPIQADQKEIQNFQTTFYKNAVSNGNTEQNSQVSIISQQYKFINDLSQSSRRETRELLSMKKTRKQNTQNIEPCFKLKQHKSNIRFATFQNQTDEDQNQAKEEKKEFSSLMISELKKKQSLEAKLEEQLSKLNDFQTPQSLLAKIRHHSESATNSQPLAQREQQEMARLQVLNQKLEKYLVEQAIKDTAECSS